MTLRSNSFKNITLETITKSNGSDKNNGTNTLSLKTGQPIKVMLETTLSFKDLVQDIRQSESNNSNCKADVLIYKALPAISLPEPAILFSPRPVSELDAAAVKLQKVYKSYRTRRNLADCAVVVEELWWKALDFAALRRSSVSFFNVEKPETAVSRWARARTRAAKVGKGLSKDEKAQKLALQHWLEADQIMITLFTENCRKKPRHMLYHFPDWLSKAPIDPRHRYGHNLHIYYDIWFESQSSQPFFYWLDVGDGKELNLEKCPRINLNRQCIKYLGPTERGAYEVVVENGKLLYRQSGSFVETVEGSKWIFVLSTSRNLYVGKKKKGLFQHSSFLAGGATTAAGRLVAHEGVLEAIWPYSGHYHPTEENFREFISFLQENNVDLTNVKRCAIDDDSVLYSVTGEELQTQLVQNVGSVTQSEDINSSDVDGPSKKPATPIHVDSNDVHMEAPVFNMVKRLSCKWTSGTGPRIGCVRDYPADLQSRALEQVNLSPRVAPGHFGNYGPIPSPRPSPKVRVSPRLAYMGLPSPRTPIAVSN